MKLYLKTVASLYLRAKSTGIGYYGLGAGVTEEPIYNDIGSGREQSERRRPPPRHSFKKPVSQEFLEDRRQKELYQKSVYRAIKRMAFDLSFEKKISYDEALERVKKLISE